MCSILPALGNTIFESLRCSIRTLFSFCFWRKALFVMKNAVGFECFQLFQDVSWWSDLAGHQLTLLISTHPRKNEGCRDTLIIPYLKQVLHNMKKRELSVVEIPSVFKKSFALCPCPLWNEDSTAQGARATSPDVCRGLQEQQTSDKLGPLRKLLGLVRLWESIHVKHRE